MKKRDDLSSVWFGCCFLFQCLEHICMHLQIILRSQIYNSSIVYHFKLCTRAEGWVGIGTRGGGRGRGGGGDHFQLNFEENKVDFLLLIFHLFFFLRPEPVHLRTASNSITQSSFLCWAVTLKYAEALVLLKQFNGPTKH